MKRLLLSIPLLCLLQMSPALSADAIKGERLARRWCAECHLVAADQTKARTDVPSFASLGANRNADEILHFLTQAHPRMPDMNLSRDEIADLYAYMRKLAGTPLSPTPGPDNLPRDHRG